MTQVLTTALTSVQTSAQTSAQTMVLNAARTYGLAATRAATIVLALASVVCLLCWQIAHQHALPVYDDVLDHLKFYRADSFGAFVAYLFSSHNEHHLTTTRLLSVADSWLWGGQLHLQAVAANLLQLGSAVIAYRIFRQGQPDDNAANRLWALATILLFFLNANFLTNFALGFNVQHFIMGLLCVAAASVVARADPIHGLRRTIPALVGLAAVATVTLGNAFVILLAAAALAIVLRWPRRPTLALIVLALAHLAFMLWLAGTKAPAGAPDLFGMLKFMLVYLGGPFIRLLAWPANDLAFWHSGMLAVLLGGMVLAAALGGAWQRWRRPGWGGAAVTFGLMLLAMVIATALAAAYSRVGVGIPEGANKKYASFAALGWLGVFMIGTGAARAHWAGRSLVWRQAPLWLAMLVLLPFTYTGAVREEAIWQKWIDHNWEAAMAIFTQTDSRDFFMGVYTAPMDALADYRAAILARNNAIFARYDFRMGDPLSRAIDGRIISPCLGTVEVKAQLPDSDNLHILNGGGTQYLVSGWSWLIKDDAPGRDIVVVDRDEKIVGLAHATRPSLAANDRLGVRLPQNAGWLGFVRIAQPTPLTFYALSGNGRSACKFGELD